MTAKRLTDPHVDGLYRPEAVQPAHDTGRPRTLWPLLASMGFLSVGGFVGGVSFVTDRTGAAIGARLSWLDETPVHDFLLPGLFLLLVFGVGTLLLMGGLIWRFSPRVLDPFEQWTGFRWPWTGTIGVGLLLVVWIMYEFTIFPDRIALQPILLVVGALMIGTPLLPSMRRYCRATEGGRLR